MLGCYNILLVRLKIFAKLYYCLLTLVYPLSKWAIYTTCRRNQEVNGRPSFLMIKMNTIIISCIFYPDRESRENFKDIGEIIRMNSTAFYQLETFFRWFILCSGNRVPFYLKLQQFLIITSDRFSRKLAKIKYNQMKIQLFPEQHDRHTNAPTAENPHITLQ